MDREEMGGLHVILDSNESGRRGGVHGGSIEDMGSRIAYQIQASAPASSCFTLSGYFSKLSQTTDFSFDVSAPGPAFCGTAVGRRARALMDVIEGLERACLMTSVATKPVEPATMSFILLVS